MGVKNFPAFVVVDDKGNDFFKEWSAAECYVMGVWWW